MKKGFLLLIATGSILVSCGGSEAEAADEFCDCYEGWMKVSKDAGEATSTDDLFGSASEMREEMEKAGTCLAEWKEKWEGEVEEEAVIEEIKENHKDVYEFLESKGIKL